MKRINVAGVVAAIAVTAVSMAIIFRIAPLRKIVTGSQS